MYVRIGVFLYVCTHAYMYTSMRVCTHTYSLQAYLSTSSHVCMYVCIYMCMHACIYRCVYSHTHTLTPYTILCMYSCFFVCTHGCMYTSMSHILFCMYVRMHACIHPCVYLHTHTLCRPDNLQHPIRSFAPNYRPVPSVNNSCFL